MSQKPAPMIQHANATIALGQIDTTDTHYRISTETTLERLTDSIKDIGLTTPPWLSIRDGRHIVLSGFRRIDVCRRLNLETIHANIVEPGTTPLQCAKLAIADNALQRELTLLEHARAYHLLEQKCVSDKELLLAAQVVGLPNPLDMVKKIAKLARASSILQQGIESDVISLPMALEIMGMPEASADYFSALFLELKPGLNRQREYVNLITEIAQRESVPPSAVFQFKAVDGIMKDDKKDNRQRSESLRRYLKTRRYPELTRKEKSAHQLIRAIRPGQGIKIVPPPFFEGGQYTIQINFSSIDQLSILGDKITHLAENPLLNELLS